MTALLPCPFCGASPYRKLGRVWQERHHGETHQETIIECPHLCAKMTGTSDAALITRWNRRAASLPTREEIGRAIAEADGEDYMEDCMRFDRYADAALRLLGRETPR